MKAKIKRFTMNRSGNFDVTVGGSHHCGIKKFLNVRYHVKIVCAPKLDSRGFLFDQLTIDSFFQNIRKTTLSCERLSATCAKKLIKHIHAENPNCDVRAIDVTLSPEPYAASMTFNWR